MKPVLLLVPGVLCNATVWERVAEDYAAFDVDVTTEEPPTDAMARSSGTDLTFGTRVMDRFLRGC